MIGKLDTTLLLIISMLGSGAAKSSNDCVAREITRQGTWWQQEESIMGTQIRVELWHRNRSKACRAISAVMSEMRRIDQLMSPYIETSQLSELNRDGASQPKVVSAELYDLIEESIRYSELTGGAFDVTYASVGRYYDYRQNQKPDNETIDETIPAIDYHHLTLSKADHTIHFQHEGVYVDLGGIAKGYAVDRGIAMLENRGIDQAMISAGGDSRILGDRKGEPWVVGVKHPRAADDDDMVAILPLTNVSVSTSGDYERYFEQDGIRYHHIIDPDTGDSARNVTSVTILGAEAVMTDALSTSVFVLGVEKGLELINKLANIDAIIVDGEGRMFLSDSLASMSELKTAGAH